VPSLALLYTLVLRGRLDTTAPSVPSVPSVPSAPSVAAEPAGRGPVTAGRVAWAFAFVTLVAGVGLLVFAGPAWALGIGALLLVACAVTVFALAAIPGEET
jgi:hypothetical protein